MKLKKAILSVLNRDGLRIIIDNLEIGGVDKRSADEMHKTLSRYFTYRFQTVNHEKASSRIS